MLERLSPQLRLALIRWHWTVSLCDADGGALWRVALYAVILDVVAGRSGRFLEGCHSILKLFTLPTVPKVDVVL